MTRVPSDPSTARRPLRLWPGVLIVAMQWLGRFVVPVFWPDALYPAILGAMAAGLLILLWWGFFSRAPGWERLGGVVLMIAAVAATPLLLHPSIATAAMGMLFYLYAIPVLSLAFVVWAVATRNLADRLRRTTMVATVLIACGLWTLLRVGGINAEAAPDFAWRWTPTPEERLLATAGPEPTPPPAAPAPEVPVLPKERAEAARPAPPGAPAVTAETAETAETVAAADPAQTAAMPATAAMPGAAIDWPGFRGPWRDSVLAGVRIATDWSASPPVEVWRRPVGPGWSSFAVRGDHFYTQEQRGEDEIVACYRVATGEPVWFHRDATRFWEANAGAGPRGTPTVSDGRVYTFGATGVVNALDAADGSVVWSHDAASDTDTAVPYWGFSSSPAVTEDLVIVAVSGRLVAYDRATGEPRWQGPARGISYSSPHLLTIDGVPQVLLLSKTGLAGFSPADGALLWEHPWQGFPIVQPNRTPDGDVLISVSAESGTRRLALAQGPGGWSVEERWTSIGLKPYFNDFVVHEGHAYGFDGSILAAIGLDDGERKWKGGRYGHGQLVLLADQDLLVVLSEKGELALVAATPDRFNELARFPAIQGKTWNHPVLAGDLLLVRNGEEMAAFRLALAGG